MVPMRYRQIAKDCPPASLTPQRTLGGGHRCMYQDLRHSRSGNYLPGHISSARRPSFVGLTYLDRNISKNKEPLKLEVPFPKQHVLNCDGDASEGTLNRLGCQLWCLNPSIGTPYLSRGMAGQQYPPKEPSERSS